MQAGPTAAARDHDAHEVRAGLDIGLSTTKIAYQIGLQGEPLVHCLPSRALPVGHSELQAFGLRLPPFESMVTINQKPWMTAIDSPFLGYDHNLKNRNLVEMPEWLAHARAALARLGQSRISELVVGIPLDQLTPWRRELASERLVGVHPLPHGAQIEVERVTVVPQAAGALRLWEVQYNARHGRTLDRDAPVLVVDCGHRAVNWMLTLGRAILPHCSGASAVAGARLQRRVRAMLKAQLRLRVGAARMEWRCRQVDCWIDLGKATIHLNTYLRAAGLRIVPGVIHELRAALGPLKDGLHSIVLTGGLTELFAPAMKAAFPHASLVCLDEPTLANARGLLQIARSSPSTGG